jgi:hypothetical protein
MAVGENGLVMSVATVGRWRERVGPLLRSSGPLPPLSRRSQVFDVIVALSLVFAAAIAGDDATYSRTPSPRSIRTTHPAAVASAAGPFLPIEHDQTSSTVLLFVVVALPLVVPAPLPAGGAVARTPDGPAMSDNDAALRVSFYACVIASYTAAVYSPTGGWRWRACRWRP